MTDLHKAARYAKEVLDYVDRFLNMNEAIRYELVRDAIADLDKALAQPEQSKYSDIVSDGGFERSAEMVRKDEREAVIDIVARHGGSVEIEASIRQRGKK